MVSQACRDLAQGILWYRPRSPQTGDLRSLSQTSQSLLPWVQSGWSLHLRDTPLACCWSHRPLSTRWPGFLRPTSRDPRHPRRRGCERLLESPRFSFQRRGIFGSVLEERGKRWRRRRERRRRRRKLRDWVLAPRWPYQGRGSLLLLGRRWGWWGSGRWRGRRSHLRIRGSSWLNRQCWRWREGYCRHCRRWALDPSARVLMPSTAWKEVAARLALGEAHSTPNNRSRLHLGSLWLKSEPTVIVAVSKPEGEIPRNNFFACVKYRANFPFPCLILLIRAMVTFNDWYDSWWLKRFWNDFGNDVGTMLVIRWKLGWFEMKVGWCESLKRKPEGGDIMQNSSVLEQKLTKSRPALVVQ